MEKKSILFVCTGNTFRSMIAEYAFKKYLSDKKITNWKVSSAGITAEKQKIDSKILSVFKKKGITIIKHKQKKLTKKMLNQYDIIIAMAKNHFDFIKSNLNHKNVFLFNDLALNKKTSIEDIIYSVNGARVNRSVIEKKIDKITKDIFRKIPILFNNASERFFLFSDFVNGLKSHRNGYPFTTLYETKNTISFMSMDIPQKEDGHILVIPKKRYADLSEIPSHTLSEIINSIKKIGTSLSKNHGGYNVILNNGADAEQYIFHTHFHIIPRNYNDGIKIEVWKHKNISIEDFIKLNKKLVKQINSD